MAPPTKLQPKVAMEAFKLLDQIEEQNNGNSRTPGENVHRLRDHPQLVHNTPRKNANDYFQAADKYGGMMIHEERAKKPPTNRERVIDSASFQAAHKYGGMMIHEERPKKPPTTKYY